MKTRMFCATFFALAALAWPSIAMAYDEFPTASGATVQGQVMMYLDGNGHATPVSPSTPLPGSSSGGSSSASFGGTPVAPDASTVVTGGTAVTALAAGHATGGGQIWNPTGAAGPLCVSLVGAAGTSEGGGTTCIPPGLNFTIAAQAGAVSVNAADSGHVFAGTGYIGTGTITYTPHAPDASTVTTGGTAVTAFAAGDVIGGGYLNNPSTAVGPLCVALVGTAGTASGGATQCIPAGQPFYIASQTGAVSVNATDSGHAFSGTGYH